MQNNTKPINERSGIWKTYDATNGLPGGILCMLQDKFGYLLLGTRVGVYRFDGLKFSRLEPVIPGEILCMLEDSHNRLWFSSMDNGLFCLYDNNLKKYTFSDGLPSNHIKSIFERGDGTIYIGTSHGVAVFNGQSFDLLPLENGFGNKYTNAICEDHNGYLWFGTINGLICYNGKGYTQNETLIDDAITSLHTDRNGKIWIGLLNGVDSFDGVEINRIKELDGSSVYSTCEDHKGNLWFATYNNGVWFYDGQDFINYNTNNGLLDNRVKYIIQDQEGLLWFSHPHSGLTCFDPWTIEFLANEPVTESITQDKNGNIWFANEDILYCLSGDCIKSRIFGKRIFSILADSKGYIWVGTQGDGLFCFYNPDDIWKENNKNFDRWDLGLENIYAILEGSDGTIWIGGGLSEKLYRFDGKSFEYIQIEDNYIIFRLYEDKHKRIWIGGWGKNSLSCFDGQKITHYTKEAGIPSDKIQSILEDDEGNIWIGTQNGICTFDGNEFKKYEIEHGCPGIFHQCSTRDYSGQLWFGTLGGGVFRTDRNHFQCLTRTDGLPSNSITGFIPQKDGSMIIGTYLGIVRYHPRPAKPKAKVYEVIADHIYKNLSEIDLNFAEKGTLAISYIGLSLSTHRMKYSYILDGYDDKWQDTWDNQVFYDNLPIGNYIFKVIAINRDLIASNVATLKFSIISSLSNRLKAKYEIEIERMQQLLKFNSEIYNQSNLSDTAYAIVEILRKSGFDRAGVWIRETNENTLRGLWGTNYDGNIYNTQNETIFDTSIPPIDGYTVEISTEVMKQKIGVNSSYIYIKKGDEDKFESLWGYYPPCSGFYRRSENGDNICIPIVTEGERIGIIAVDNYITKRNIGESPANFFHVIGSEMSKALVNVALRESLEKEKEQLAVTLRSIGDGVITTDEYGSVILINKIAEELTGWSEKEAVGKPLRDIFNIINKDSREKLDNPAENILISDDIVNLGDNIILVSKGSSEYLISYSRATVRNRTGKVTGIVLVFRDITEKQRIEDELLKTDKLESIGILAGGIAHDFNNILTGILGNISLARMLLSPNDKAYQRLTEAEKSSLNAKNLTQQLLIFSRGGTLVLRLVSVSEILTNAVSFALKGSNVKCNFNFKDSLWKIKADEGQIIQAINNIIINASQAMPDGGEINVIAENVIINDNIFPSLRGGKYVKISIEDRGIGIPKEHLQKIFDPYFTTKQKGSGLGLSATYSIIKKHDGYIDVKSELGVGTVFYLYLPVYDDTEFLENKESKEILLENLKILVVDDQEIILELVQAILENLGHTVETAKDGYKAIDLYRSAKDSDEAFDAVIMDLTIPGGMGGKEATAKILEFDSNAKIIVSSGYSDHPVMSEFEEYGFCGFIPKPYRTKELIDTLNSVLIKKGR